MAKQDQGGTPAVTVVPGNIVAEDSDHRFIVCETEAVAGQRSEKKPFLIMTPAGERLGRASSVAGALKKGEELLAKAAS